MPVLHTLCLACPLKVLIVLHTQQLAGGRTTFTHCGVSITPKRGRALLFFPATVDNRADARTLHEAQAAVDEKWVAQQWHAPRLVIVLLVHEGPHAA